ncbi:MAG TPA: hypothetical protein VM734_05635 [Kofleriaceae bacterium]|nr:hypothetical protein [Kofleriaceae bacterium]
MTPRRLSALLCLAGAVLIAWAVLTNAWWSARIRNDVAVADLKIGLVSLTGCTHDAGGTWRCESVDWKRVGVTADSALWVWSGRLLFGVALAAAIALAVTAVIAAVPRPVSLPVSPPRLALAFGAVAVVLIGLYRVSTPDMIKLLLDGGRGWWLSLAGLAVGAVGAVRELDPADPDA